MVKSAIPAAPRVRIVQVCSPRIVHADLKSFRATVQKLTGFRRRITQPDAANDDLDRHGSLAPPASGIHRPILQSKEAMDVKEEPYQAGFDSDDIDQKKWWTGAWSHAVPDYLSHDSDLRMDLQRFFRAYENQCASFLEQQDEDLEGIAEGKLESMHPRAHFPAYITTSEFEDDLLSLGHFFTEEGSDIS